MGTEQRLISRRKESEQLRSATDQDLLGKVAEKSQEAFEALYRRLEQRLYLYLLGLIRDRTMAEELVSETFFEVWRQAGAFRGASAVSTWIFAIARNKALGLLRKRPQTFAGEETLENLPAEAEDPAEALAQRERADQVRQALRALSPEHREVMELSFYHNLSCQEIAGIAGCPVNTVKTRMFYARRQLRRTLAKLYAQEEAP